MDSCSLIHLMTHLRNLRMKSKIFWIDDRYFISWRHVCCSETLDAPRCHFCRFLSCFQSLMLDLQPSLLSVLLTEYPACHLHPKAPSLICAQPLCNVKSKKDQLFIVIFCIIYSCTFVILHSGPGGGQLCF